MSEEIKTVYEVFEKIDALKQNKRRIDLLKNNDTFVIRTILQAAFSPKIQFGMPVGAPPIEQTEVPITYRELNDNSIRTLGQCVNTKLKYYEREAIFTRLCSISHPNDVKVLVAMKDKNITGLFPSITKKFVKEVFPNLIQ